MEGFSDDWLVQKRKNKVLLQKYVKF